MGEVLGIENRKPFFVSILLAYKDFSVSYNLERLKSSDESWILFLSFTGSLILFLANLPYQIAILPSFTNGSLTFYVGLLGFIAVFFMPLFLYLLSTAIFVLLKVFNGRGSFYEVRLAFFWSLNVAGPILIINGLLKGFFFESGKLIYINLVLETFVGWIIANMMSEAEQFSSKYPIFFTIVLLIILPLLMPLI